jgi:hypothetical protein
VVCEREGIGQAPPAPLYLLAVRCCAVPELPPPAHPLPLPVCFREWSEEKRMEWLLSELTGKRPLLPPDLPMTPEVGG